ncbi:MAG TPA: hypothetical protein VFH27_13970 [Longimicrobiaceae bacterium]|nr:hypothetical protein [Longimicrobiaceae bacterium]
MRTAVLALALLAAAPLSAQVAAGHDHDAAVQGAPLPAGWSVRLDRPDANRANLRFVAERGGFHFTGGPAAILYRDADTGASSIRARFAQLRAPSHPEAYGLFVGGKNLQAAGQEYLYFIVRGDGKYMVKHRAGAEVHTISDWTASPALAAANPAGRAVNMLEIRVRADGAHLVANGRELTVVPGSWVGTAGLRINHNLDVRVDQLRVARGGSGPR